MNYDLIIIGGGAAGFAAAIKADGLKKKTLMISGGNVALGGTCINVGCMPSKQLLSVAESYWNAKTNTYAGLNTAGGEIDFAKVIEAKDALIEELQGKQYAGTLKFLVYVTLKEGDASFIDERTVQVDGETFTGDKIIITTGSSTFIPPIEGIENIPYLTNIEALSLKELPASMLIVGGGPLGLEFAQMFNRFGTKVTVVQSVERLVNREEPEISAFIERALKEEGIRIYTSAKARRFENGEGGIRTTIEVDGKDIVVQSERVLLAAGVRANTESLDLGKAGVSIGDGGGIITNDMLQSSVPHIYAAGDVVDESGHVVHPKLETVAGREGFIAASNALEQKGMRIKFTSVPHAVFTDPPIASVGMTEAQIEMVDDVACACRTLTLELVPKAHIVQSTGGLIKMATDGNTGVIMGIHMAGARADEIISMASLIVKQKMTVDDIIENTFIFPTMAESIKWVAQSFRKDVSKLSCCTE
jgi:mercuric reductase